MSLFRDLMAVLLAAALSVFGALGGTEKNAESDDVGETAAVVDPGDENNMNGYPLPGG